jgi:peptidoglycan/LPS O-acetylase OafA/YrhL
MHQRLLALDIARGLAAGGVLFIHLGNNISISESPLFYSFVKFLYDSNNFLFGANNGLHWGVVVFIVLSGFCIHMPSARQGLQKVNISVYARRRFYRIFPVLIAASLIGLIAHTISNGFSLGAVGDLLINMTMAPSLMLLPELPGNGILITVIAECLLYAAYPICFPKNKIGWFYILVAAVTIHIANFSLLYFAEISPSWLVRNFYAFFLYWWIGAIFAELAFNANGWRPIIPTGGTIIVIVYVIYVLFGNFVHFEHSMVPKTLYLAVMTGFFLYVVSKNGGDLAQIKMLNFIFRPLAKIGEYSYSLYVVHVPILML